MPPRALLPIPSDLTPTGSKCVRFNLPEDGEWLGMFWGALYHLTVWSSYDRDDTHSAKIVAQVWKNIIDTARASDCSGSEFQCFYDFMASPDPWVIYGAYGFYSASGYETSDFGGPPPTGYSLIVYVTLPVATHITHVRMKATFNLGGNDAYALYTFSGSTLVPVSAITAAFGGTEIIDIFVNLSLNTLVVNLSGNAPGHAILHDITIYSDDVDTCA